MKEILCNVVEYYSNIVDMTLYYLMLRPICNVNKKKKKKKKRAILGLIGISQVMELSDYYIENESPVILLIGIILYTLWGIRNTKKKNRKRVFFRVILTSAGMAVSSGLCVVIAILFLKMPIDALKYPCITRSILIIVSSLCSFAIIRCIMYFLKENILIQYTSFVYIISTLFVLYILSLYCCIQNVERTKYLLKEIQANILLSMLIFTIHMLIILFVLGRILYEIRRVVQIKDENSLQREIIQQQKKAIKNIRKTQHEYKNNIGSIHALLLSQKVDKADSLMDQLLNQSISTDKMIRNNETFIHIICNYKMKEAVQKHIIISKEINLCNDIPIDEYDLALVINNAMDNAIESCEKLPISKRYIKCMIHIKLRYLNFYFENACASNLDIDNDHLRTSKEEASEHGFGVQNITSVVKKYHGFIKYYSKDGAFYLKFSLLIPDCKSA